MALTPGRPRVAHIVPALFGPSGVTGGAERYVFELARAMAAVTPTALITFGPEAARHEVDALQVTVLGARMVRGQRTNPFAFRLVAALRHVDVIHCHQTHVLSSSYAALIARASGRRVFTTDLGGGGLDLSSFISTDRLFHGHLHISEYSRRISGHERLPSARVISGGVDAVKFSPDPGARREGMVLFVGRLLPHKGLDDLIDALPADMPAEIIGEAHDAGYRESLGQRAAGKRILFRSGVPDDQLVEAYRRAACVVLPSVYRTRQGLETAVPELLGQTLLEGMACETPGICTDVASLPEVIEHGVTGLIVPPGNPAALRDALQRVRAQPTEARAMGRRARQRVLDHFSWRSVVDRCLDAYRSSRT